MMTNQKELQNEFRNALNFHEGQFFVFKLEITLFRSFKKRSGHFCSVTFLVKQVLKNTPTSFDEKFEQVQINVSTQFSSKLEFHITIFLDSYPLFSGKNQFFSKPISLKVRKSSTSFYQNCFIEPKSK